MAFLILGMPIVFVLGIAATLTLMVTSSVPVTIVAERLYAGLDSFTIMAIPFFIFAGVIMDAGGISRRIVALATAIVGWITGSLLMVSIVAATGLAAISGSGSADTAAVAAIMRPEIERRKYNVPFAAGIIAAAGSLAQVIPPSLMMVVVAMIGNLSVGALFLGGVIPGLLTSSGLLICAYLHARRGGPQYREVESFTLARLARATWAAIPAVGMAVIIIGGIIGGVFTPTEAAGVAVAYGLLVGIFVYRDLKVTELPALILRAVTLSAAVMAIVGTANIFGWLIASLNVPALLGGWLKSISQEPWVYLLLVNILLMIVGCFMESIAAILVLSPVLLPIALSFGIDPIHFGVVMVMNFAIGLITPPYGITLFVASTIFERRVITVARELFWPWLWMTAILLLTTFVPELVLYLPRLAGLV
ncbi:MAG: TRAP transporter large permease [Pseudomonadota bacterium]